MKHCATSSYAVIRKGGSRLIRMGTASSLRAHQITQPPFIARLFVITPNWLLRSCLWFGHWTLCPLRKKKDDDEREEKDHLDTIGWCWIVCVVGRGGGGDLKLEISRRKREGEIKHFKVFAISLPLSDTEGELAVHLRGCWAALSAGRDRALRFGMLIEVSDTACDTPAETDALNKHGPDNGSDTHTFTPRPSALVITNTLPQIEGIFVRWWTDRWSAKKKRKARLPDWN